MRGGTGRLPGRDDARDPDRYMFLSSHTAYMEAGRFSSRQPGSRLERDDFCHINASSRLAWDNIVLTLRFLQ